jgi:hypothetical protein
MAVTSALPENFLLRAHVVLNLYPGNHHDIGPEFRYISKNFEGGLLKHILENNTVFWKKSVEIWAFDGTLIVRVEALWWPSFIIKKLWRRSLKYIYE